MSAVHDRADFLAAFSQLHALTQQIGAALVVGGRALNREIRGEMSYTTYCDRLDHLISLVQQLFPTPATAKPLAIPRNSDLPTGGYTTEA